MSTLAIALPVTLLTASVLCLMLVWLSMRVISARVKNDALIGDQGNSDLLWSIRIHGNFTEYSPLFVIMLGLLEYSAANQTVLIVLAAAFLICRILHVFGMGPDANLKLRQVGMVGTFLGLGAAGVYGLVLGLT